MFNYGQRSIFLRQTNVLLAQRYMASAYLDRNFAVDGKNV